MNEGHRDLLRKCRGDIIREIAAANCLEDILNELGYKDQNGDYGLTPEDITRIRGGGNTDASQQAGAFLDTLPRRGENAFERFKQALIKTNHIGLISVLNSASEGAFTALSKQSIQSIQQSLREMYSKRFRFVHPIAVPFAFDIEKKWVNLTLKLDEDSTVTDNYVDLLDLFNQTDMLIIEGDPATGKTSLLRRLAYEWARKEPQMVRYDLVLYAEFRKVCDQQFTNIIDLITYCMKECINEQESNQLAQLLSNDEYCKEKQILVLLDGYDESSLKKQCKQLTDYLYSTDIGKPFWFKIIVTSRKGYLSELREQEGRFIFADLLGFTTVLQKEDYIRRHFTARNGTQSTESINFVLNLLETNNTLKRLSETPLLLTFICLVHKKIKEGTELELYMNIIWWLLDRHQRNNPDRDVPGLLGFQCDKNEEKSDIIKNNYKNFPLLHMLGRMGMDDIFKTTFTETDLEKFQVCELIPAYVGLLKKEKESDDSFNINAGFSFLHRTIQEFLTAFAFFYSAEEPPENFQFYFLYPWDEVGYGIVQEKLQSFLRLIRYSDIQINDSRIEIFTKINRFVNTFRTEEGIIVVVKQGKSQLVHEIEDVPKSSEEAVNFLKKEAEEGNAKAQYSLGTIYDTGRIVGRNLQEAVKWYRKAAAQDHARAQFNLAFKYEKGKGVDQSYVKAIHWYKKAAEKGHGGAQFNLGLLYEQGQGVDQSYKEAVKWYEKAAKEGHGGAQFNLALSYQVGQGVDQSFEKAIKWYEKAAKLGHAGAQFNLGYRYEKGQGVNQSYEEALKWYRKAAEQGHPNAQNNLGEMYENQQGVAHSYDEAEKWYNKAAKQGNIYGENCLRIIYDKKSGSVPKSDKEAFLWYEKTAEKGNTDAQYKLGFMYYGERGVSRSYEKAVKWYRKAAEQGNADGQYNLAYMYQNGEGVPQSNDEAVKWYTKAAEQGHTKARLKLQENKSLQSIT